MKPMKPKQQLLFVLLLSGIWLALLCADWIDLAIQGLLWVESCSYKNAVLNTIMYKHREHKLKKQID